MHSLENRARRFASHAHASRDQRRKYTLEPYIIHPAAVVERVRSVSHSEDMLAAAWLHDTVEDTDVTLKDIDQRFGRAVAELVEMLTTPATPADCPRIEKTRAALLHMACASSHAKTIKLADIIDNTCSIITYDAQFARYYLVEKKLQIEVLTEGDPHLWRQARDILDAGLLTLQQEPHRVSQDWLSRLTAEYRDGYSQRTAKG
ncbi:HD domain-containing protein [Biostraticola tofi]|uniref:HD domain-containing protein n=1 Tax=Biostraticola tofi TaxID=466109 RepID=A0A4R3YSQ7_9GAMM|nr:HD domain-containing protein [Biostraticola tofi]TCV95520.1 HD domain-containing protein [Biostraticola tofi]